MIEPPKSKKYNDTPSLLDPCYPLIIHRGESGTDPGVPGNINEGDPALEYSNDCECDNGGV